MDVNQANKILLLINPNSKKADLFSYLTLAMSLSNSGKIVEIYGEKLNTEIKNILVKNGNTSVTVLNQIEAKRTIVTINKGNEKVKNVLWRELDDKLLFNIETLSGNFEVKDISFSHEGTDADLVIFLGCKDISAMSHVYSVNPALFTKAESINIDNQIGNTEFAKANFVSEKLSISTLINNFILQNKLTVTKEAASLSLLSLMLDTSLFTKNLDDTQSIFERVLNLIKLGASYQTSLEEYEKNKVITVTPQPRVMNTYRPVSPVRPMAPMRPVTPRPVVPNNQNLDAMFPKAKNTPGVVATDPTAKTFSPYSAPSFNRKPVYPEYRGFVPNNPPTSPQAPSTLGGVK